MSISLGITAVPAAEQHDDARTTGSGRVASAFVSDDIADDDERVRQKSNACLFERKTWRRTCTE